jgi:hypothetical protein
VFEEFSANVAEQLEGLLSYLDQDTSESQCAKLLNSTAVLARGDPINLTRPDESDGDCIHCGEPCVDMSLYCDTGNHWLHYSCEKLTKEQIQQAEDGGGSCDIAVTG